MTAASECHDEVVLLLLDKGANMEAKSNVSLTRNKYSETIISDKIYNTASINDHYTLISIIRKLSEPHFIKLALK